MRTLVFSLFIMMIVSTESYAASTRSIERADGSRIEYHLDNFDTKSSKGILLMLQGSGCESVIKRDWLTSDPPKLAPELAVLSIEKYGVSLEQANSGAVDGCSKDYWRNNTLNRRVLDAVQVIAKMRTETWWNGKLVIYGGSEGGAIAALLAPLIPEIQAVIIQSSGIGVPTADLIRMAVPPEIAVQISQVIADAKINPTGEKRMGGASYRWWADAADITPSKMLVETDVPILLIHGSRDQFAPVEAARATRDLFVSRGKSNLTYVEYDGYDHFMTDLNGVHHKDKVLMQAAEWLRSLMI